MARQKFFQVCGSEIYCKCGIYSISTVILGRSYLSETHNWMRMLDSEPQFLMARSAMQNVFWAIPCTPSKDTKVPLKANWRMYIMCFDWVKEILCIAHNTAWPSGSLSWREQWPQEINKAKTVPIRSSLLGIGISHWLLNRISKRHPVRVAVRTPCEASSVRCRRCFPWFHPLLKCKICVLI